ncbi:BTAD domain-containing putative transcriptional regulator [Kribbella sp. NPDC049174]|uniref:AfsR/SARP family transcriptional regulator n=1 Tax=Kribbella sp. NPDC049174 TaxID=3364112 RepID=UPI0037140DA8
MARYRGGKDRYRGGIAAIDRRYGRVDSRDVGIAVLGPLTIEGEQKVLGRRDRVVLAALAVHPGEVVSAEALADVLWGEQVPPSAAKIVQGCVVRLRKLLGSHAIETSALGYRLAVAVEEIDARRFERAVIRARELLAADDPERAALVLADALTLWRGRPLAELDGWDPARSEAARLTELRHTAEELYVESALRSGQHDRVLAKAQALVVEAPLRADGFFGRDTDIAACLHKLADASVLAVVGPSGCGKSSLIRAGVAAALRRNGKQVVVMTPGVHPVAALAEAMPGTGTAGRAHDVHGLAGDGVRHGGGRAGLAATEHTEFLDFRSTSGRETAGGGVPRLRPEQHDVRARRADRAGSHPASGARRATTGSSLLHRRTAVRVGVARR